MRFPLTFVFAAAVLCADPARAEETVAGFPRKITISGVTFEVATPAELKARGFDFAYPPPEQNAAIEYIQAMNALADAKKSGFPRKAYSYVLNNVWVDSPALARWLDERENVHRLIAAGAKKSQCVFPAHNARYAFGILLPHLSGLRDIERFLIVRAKRRAAAGDAAGAAQDLFLALRLAEQWRRARFLIGGLVDLALFSMASSAIADMALREDWPDDLLRQAAARLAAAQKRLPRLSDAMEGERWAGCDMVRFFLEAPYASMTMSSGAASPAEPADPDAPGARMAIAKILLPDQTISEHFECYYDQFERLSDLPPPAAVREIQEGLEERLIEQIPAWDILAKLYLPALCRARLSYIASDARLRVSRGAVELKRFQLARGRRPTRLDEVEALTRPDLRDPFTGRPLLFKPRADGWTLYSVGENLKDDGGRRWKDIAVRYPPLEPKPFRGK